MKSVPLVLTLASFSVRGRGRCGRAGRAGGIAGVALADWHWRQDAGRRRCHAVFHRADGVSGRIAPRGAAAGLERPVGLRLSRPGGEPDGGLLSCPSGSLSLAGHRDGLRRQPGAPYALGRAGSVLGGAPAGYLARGIGPGRVGLVDVRVLPDPPGPPVGLHDRMLDALGVGFDVVLPCAGGRVPKRRRRFF